MDNTIIYIKCKASKDESPLKYAYDSYKFKQKSYYNLNSQDQNNLNGINKDETHHIVFVVYKENDGKLTITEMLIGTSNWRESKDDSYGDSLRYNIIRRINSKTIIRNIAKLSELDLINDFVEGKYTSYEDSEYIISQLDIILNDRYNPEIKETTYNSFPKENDLNILAQRNEYCKRYYNYRGADAKRSEFQRDYERILHSKAFRRMVDKAQVFSASKGDYYRTRMTHTQVVAQIAGAISDALNLNYYLTQAIAIGHDIGHTPFGHQGERTLNRILNSSIQIIKNADLFDDNFGGFKHNYQSVRVATKLEEEYAGIYGIDLSYQTLEGMLKHTRINSDEYLLEEFCDYDSCNEHLHFTIDYPTTLEGQVVALADEIAQRAHDLDDALESGLLTLDQLKERLSVRKTLDIKKIFNDVDAELIEIKNKHRIFSDEENVRNNMIVSGIISYFINDIIKTSSAKISEFISNPEKLEKFKENHYVEEQLIIFSDDVSNICKHLEIIVTNKVINSNEVALFDSNAETIVSGLFNAYYNNPKLLHTGTLRRIMIEIKNQTDNVIDLADSNYKVVGDELNKIVRADLSKSDPKKEKTIEEYKFKRRVLVRAICDYIAGMTDSYAKKEYDSIVK